jgi:hypothetical protein
MQIRSPLDVPSPDGKSEEGKVIVAGMLGLMLAAFGTALLKTCSLMRNVVLRADIYEEEDFAPATYGVDLAAGTSHEQLLDLMDRAKACMIEYLTQTNQPLGQPQHPSKAKSRKKRKGRRGGGGPEQQQKEEVDSSIIHALLVLLQYRKTMYLSQVHMGRSCRDEDLDAAKDALQIAQVQLVAIADRIKEKAGNKKEEDNVSADTSEQLPKSQKSESMENKDDDTQSDEPQFGIDPKISRCLPSSSPPRALPKMPLSMAVSELRGVLSTFQFVCESPTNDTLESIDIAMEHFSKMQPPPKVINKNSEKAPRNSVNFLCVPQVCARSHMILFLYTDAGGIMGRLDIQQLIQTSFLSMGVPKLLFNTEVVVDLLLSHIYVPKCTCR